ncbi:hypothetical protein [Streptomyces sp. KL116D]|uniref:helix-turn-helix domain-containing protein n=1 Tax=Streptomyces sp. KL116D TaxID=3045152 RepID=UPI003555E4E7
MSCTQPSTTSPTGKPHGTSPARGRSRLRRPSPREKAGQHGASLRRILGDELAGSRDWCAADLTTKAATSAPTEGRVMYAGMRTLRSLRPCRPVVALRRACCASTGGGGHIAALSPGAHRWHGGPCALSALVRHPPARVVRTHPSLRRKSAWSAVMDGLRERGLVDIDGHFTDAGRATKQRIETVTDELPPRPTRRRRPPNSTSRSRSLNPSRRLWWLQARSETLWSA